MADTASPAVSLSTADTPPQHRFMDSDREKILSIPVGVITATTHAFPVFFGKKVQITGASLGNGDVAMATATDTTALDIDVYSNGATPAKVHDVCAIAATVGAAANKVLQATISTVVANTIVEATEYLRVLVTKAGTQGATTITVRYIELALSDEIADWTV